MRIFLGVVCFLFSTIMGHVLSKKYTYRRVFYTDFSEFNKIFDLVREIIKDLRGEWVNAKER